MALYMYQAAYSAESWAAQMKNPQNRVESIGRQVCEAAGGEFIGGWLCFGEYDLVIIADVPDNESMSAIAIAVGSAGAIKASKTTALLTGDQGVAALEKANAVAGAYSPAR
ncbi:MAG: GYD domain-containing protein [Hyphomicrobiales bacterium]|nr:GYD domain-containing protein [Hyphomicrobiales bacterium]